VFCCDTAGVDESLLVFLEVCGSEEYVGVCCVNVLVDFGAAESGVESAARFRCGFMLGDSRTTRAGFREVVDFRRPLEMLPLLPSTGDCDGSVGAGIGVGLCDMCGFGM